MPQQRDLILRIARDAVPTEFSGCRAWQASQNTIGRKLDVDRFECDGSTRTECEVALWSSRRGGRQHALGGGACREADSMSGPVARMWGLRSRNLRLVSGWG